MDTKQREEEGVLIAAFFLIGAVVGAHLSQKILVIEEIVLSLWG